MNKPFEVTFSSQSKETYLAYAFDMKPTFEGKIAGGLPTVLMNTVADQQNGFLNIISGDKEAASYQKFRINPRVIGENGMSATEEGKLKGDWFDEQWVMLHPEAYFRELDLYGLVNYVDFARPMEIIKGVRGKFARTFFTPFDNIPNNAVVNIQDYFFIDLMEQKAEELRSRGCKQSFHLHTTLPEQLADFARGREMIKAMSKMDRVYLHTDEYVGRLKRQMEEMFNGGQLSQSAYDRLVVNGNIRRFDLGPDFSIAKAVSANEECDNFERFFDAKAGYRVNNERFKTEAMDLVKEALGTRGKIPHRFLCMDRIDAIKGVDFAIDGIRTFLREKRSAGENLASLYRFFLVNPVKDFVINSPSISLNDRHIIKVQEELDAIVAEFPGVVFSSSNIPRQLIPYVLRGNNLITGGIQDGLNLSCQEALYLNHELGEDVSAIIGKGAGFAMQTIADHKENYDDMAFFVQPSDVIAIKDAINSIVNKKRNPQELARMTRRIVSEVISKRREGIVVSF